jgi:hypothetical protein
MAKLNQKKARPHGRSRLLARARRRDASMLGASPGRSTTGPPAWIPADQPGTTGSCETAALQGCLSLLCPPGPALHTPEHDS